VCHYLRRKHRAVCALLRQMRVQLRTIAAQRPIEDLRGQQRTQLFERMQSKSFARLESVLERAAVVLVELAYVVLLYVVVRRRGQRELRAAAAEIKSKLLPEYMSCTSAQNTACSPSMCSIRMPHRNASPWLKPICKPTTHRSESGWNSG
jgi:hypothetical protein